MNAAIILIIIGILVWMVLPKFLSGSASGKSKKRKKKKTQQVMVCKVIGWLLIFLGVYNAISVLVGE